jgi:hypothetical protein
MQAGGNIPEIGVLLAGVYTIADEGSDARLMYELEVPKEPQSVQQELNIGKTGNFSLQIKVWLWGLRLLAKTIFSSDDPHYGTAILITCMP